MCIFDFLVCLTFFLSFHVSYAKAAQKKKSTPGLPTSSYLPWPFRISAFLLFCYARQTLMYDQILALMSPEPVANAPPSGLGATEMTEFL